MQSERWKQVEELFHSALEQDERLRREFVEKACSGDRELLREVESLLDYEKPSESFMEAPAMEVAALEPAKPYEQGLPTLYWVLNVTMCPVDARGEAYLTMGRGAEAAVEFQKIIDHPGLVGTFPLGALARLGLGRAYALEAGVDFSGERKLGAPSGAAAGKANRTPVPAALAKARSAYQEFFTLWRSADPDIPILKQARAEYSRLQ